MKLHTNSKTKHLMNHMIRYLNDSFQQHFYSKSEFSLFIISVLRPELITMQVATEGDLIDYTGQLNKASLEKLDTLPAVKGAVPFLSPT